MGCVSKIQGFNKKFLIFDEYFLYQAHYNNDVEESKRLFPDLQLHPEKISEIKDFSRQCSIEMFVKHFNDLSIDDIAHNKNITPDLIKKRQINWRIHSEVASLKTLLTFPHFI